jgi:hypothetical protein
MLRRRSSAESPWRSNCAARFLMLAVNSMPSTALILANCSRPSVVPVLALRTRLPKPGDEPRFFMHPSYHECLILSSRFLLAATPALMLMPAPHAAVGNRCAGPEAAILGNQLTGLSFT